MVKRKSRAARRDQRRRALKAEERGLPQMQEAAPPQKARRVRGDVTAAALASDKHFRGRRANFTQQTEKGLPVFAKVLIGAAMALVIVYVLSQFRKSDTATRVKEPVGGLEHPGEADRLDESPAVSAVVDEEDTASVEADVAPHAEEKHQEVVLNPVPKPEEMKAKAPTPKTPGAVKANIGAAETKTVASPLEPTPSPDSKHDASSADLEP